MDQAYKALRDEWYAKLKQSGFDDIEDVNSPREMLKQWHSIWFHTTSDPLHFKCKHRYFRMAEQFLNNFRFRSHIEKKIWSLHVEGLSLREIGSEVGLNKDKVNKIVLRFKKTMRRGF